jgi:hypothetical protein
MFYEFSYKKFEPVSVNPAIYNKMQTVRSVFLLSYVGRIRGENSLQVVLNLPEFGEIFAESEGLLPKEQSSCRQNP